MGPPGSSGYSTKAPLLAQETAAMATPTTSCSVGRQFFTQGNLLLETCCNNKVS